MTVTCSGDLASFRRLLENNTTPFDIVLLDLSLPKEFGTAIIEPLRSNTNTGIIVVSSHSEEATKLEALALGADDYITKPVNLKELLARIHNLHTRLTNSPYMMAKQRLATLLSDRELSVLAALARGRSNKELAIELEISPRTAETYRQRITEKLGVKSIAELTQAAVRAGLV